MAITPDQIAKLAQDHATEFALNVSIQFLMDYYIADYLQEFIDDIETIMFDIYNHNNQNPELTKNFLIESGINAEDANNVLAYYIKNKKVL